MNNSVFGKTMKNIDKRIDVKIVSNWTSAGERLDAWTLVSNSYFHSSIVIIIKTLTIKTKEVFKKYECKNVL